MSDLPVIQLTSDGELSSSVPTDHPIFTTTFSRIDPSAGGTYLRVLSGDILTLCDLLDSRWTERYDDTRNCCPAITEFTLQIHGSDDVMRVLA